MSIRTTDIKSALDDLAVSWQGWKTKYDARQAELLDRVEELESWRSSPGKTYSGDSEELKLFLNWFRQPYDHKARSLVLQYQSDMQRKAVTIGTPAAGGLAVPEEIGRDIDRRVSILNPFRSLVTVRRISTSRYYELVDMHDDASGWVGEGGSRSETATSTLRQREPTMGTIYSYPKASEESLADIVFNVQDWLVDTASDSFAAQEAIAIVSGNGSDKPTGFLAATPTTADDDASPMRAAGTLKYEVGYGGSPAALHADELIAVATSSLKERYMMGPSVAWVMSRTALAAVRQLKDDSGRFIWSESLAPGVPSTLLGFPLFTSDAMPAASAGNFAIAFGNWRRGYLFCDRVDLRITVDDNVTTPGQHKFYIRKRLGGCVRNNDALRAIKWAAS